MQPPRAIAETMDRQLLRTSCTWWCVARVWADRITVHPNFGLAIQSLKAAAALPSSRVRDEALRIHAAYVGLRPVLGQEGDYRLEPEDGADERTIAAVRVAAREDAGSRSKRRDFDPVCGAGEHAIRVAARVKALQLRPRGAKAQRKHAEGLLSADVEHGRSGWRHSTRRTEDA